MWGGRMCEMCEWGDTQDPKRIVVAHEAEGEIDLTEIRPTSRVLLLSGQTNWPWREEKHDE